MFLKQIFALEAKLRFHSIVFIVHHYRSQSQIDLFSSAVKIVHRIPTESLVETYSEYLMFLFRSKTRFLKSNSCTFFQVCEWHITQLGILM